METKIFDDKLGDIIKTQNFGDILIGLDFLVNAGYNEIIAFLNLIEFMEQPFPKDTILLFDGNNYKMVLIDVRNEKLKNFVEYLIDSGDNIVDIFKRDVISFTDERVFSYIIDYYNGNGIGVSYDVTLCEDEYEGDEGDDCEVDPVPWLSGTTV